MKTKTESKISHNKEDNVEQAWEKLRANRWNKASNDTHIQEKIKKTQRTIEE